MDPFSKVHPEKDSTYLLIREALNRKYRAYFCEHVDLFARDKVFARTQEIKNLRPDPKVKTRSNPTLKEAQEKTLALFDVVLMHTDPPIDFNYFSATYYNNN